MFDRQPHRLEQLSERREREEVKMGRWDGVGWPRLTKKELADPIKQIAELVGNFDNQNAAGLQSIDELLNAELGLAEML